MKNPKFCTQCQKPVPRDWRDLGFLRIDVSYNDGSKRTIFTCGECRQKNAEKNEALKPLGIAGEGI